LAKTGKAERGFRVVYFLSAKILPVNFKGRNGYFLKDYNHVFSEGALLYALYLLQCTKQSPLFLMQTGIQLNNVDL
jgi:hypothetical protein